MRGGLAVRSEEQAGGVPRVFPTGEMARGRVCSAGLLGGRGWRRVGCVVEDGLEFRQ